MLFPVHQVEELVQLGHRDALAQADESRQVARLLQHRRAADRLRKALAAGLAAGLDVKHVAAELMNLDSVNAN